MALFQSFLHVRTNNSTQIWLSLTLRLTEYHIDVIDNARIHLIAAAFDASVENERIFTFARPFTFTEMIEILRELRPDSKTLASPPENEGQDLSKVPNERGAELLKKWYKQDGGYKTMRQSIEECLESLEGQI